jgi:SAM-dependent methyltransferase
MDAAAYRDYQRESESWLKKGRRNLLSSMLRQSGGGRKDLKLLEVGAGVGQNVPALLEFGQVDVIEISDVGLEALRKIGGIRNVMGDPIPFDLKETYDVIVAMDVVEHIEDDRGALSWMAQHLKPGGLLFATVPAYQWLFSEHDVALHHFRRYTARELKRAFPPSVEVLRCGYFNSVLFPVAASVRLSKKLVRRNSKEQPARKQSGLMPRPVNALFKSVLDSEVWAIRKGLDLPFGLSVYCLAKRPPAQL